MNMEKVQTHHTGYARGKQRTKEAIICLKLNGHDPKSGLLLDLGCGPGHIYEHLVYNGIDAVGVEICRHKIQIAKKNVPKGNFIVADGCNLPFKKGCFNTVISNDVLEHVPYDSAVPMLNEVDRVLTQNGLYYFSVANKYQIHEPHTLIPFLTWFPQSCWNIIHKWVRKTQMKEMYYPYTVRAVKRLCRETKFDYKDFTWMYALYKTSKTDYIGNSTVRRIIKVIKKIGFSRPAQILAEKVSVIVFVCRKY